MPFILMRAMLFPALATVKGQNFASKWSLKFPKMALPV
jgi:hypothetical protein